MDRPMPSPMTALFAVLGALVFVGLAVLGWGGFGGFFAHPARTALVAVTAMLTAASLFTGGNISPGEREDRGNRWVLAVFTVLGLLGAYVPAWTDRMEVWTLDGDTMRWFGVALFALGGAVRIWPVFVLGRRFSGLVAIQPGHTLVTDGIYGVIRNPSYLGLIAGTLGWALTFRSGIGVVLALLNLPPLIARIRSEERLLADQFGAEYEAYRRRTWRLVPGLY